MRNLSEVSLRNRALVWYFIILVAIAGIFSYIKLGRMEDPTYTVRTMIVTVAWPGATAEQMEEQVTDKIEKKLQDTPHLDYLKSYSRPGNRSFTSIWTIRRRKAASAIRGTKSET